MHLNLVNPRYQTGVNSVTMNPTHGYMTPVVQKTTKPPYCSLSILVVVLVHFIVRSETALVA
jgi:hypothetical protein